MERRIARDGVPYTQEQFLEFYGEFWGPQLWEEAAWHAAGALQPGGQVSGAPQPAAPPAMAHAAAEVPSSPVTEPAGLPPATPPQPGGPPSSSALPLRLSGGAPQPGGNPWQGSFFLTRILQQNWDTLRRECPHLWLATTPRGAIDKAYWLQDYLPLPVQAFVDCDLVAALCDTSGAGQVAQRTVHAVVAEKIPRIPDHPCSPRVRVDFFVCCCNGDVIRYHPGIKAKTTMRPHVMPFGSLLFSFGQAKDIGVGASLHLRPPRRVLDAGASQPGVLCTHGGVDECCAYDVQMWTWRRVQQVLPEPGQQGQVDVSDGQLFPWWLLLGGTLQGRFVLDRGVTKVVVSGRAIILTVLDGQVSLFSDTRRRMVLYEDVCLC